MKRLNWSIFAIFIGCCVAFTAQAQLFKKKGNKRVKKVTLNSDPDPVSIEVADIDFKNINKIPFYLNNKQLKRIEQLESEQKWSELYYELRDYVSNFGIQNFAYQTYYLWRLAKLTEVFGSAEQAKPLYRLVLKHHRMGLNIEEVLARYDSLNRDKTQYYVPLEYYYELVEFRRQVDTLIPPRGILTNMGKMINSTDEDYAPSVAMNDSVLLFTSKRNSFDDGIHTVINEDIFITQKAQYWKPARPFEAINTQYNEGSACLSKDGKTLFFTRCDSPEGLGNCDIYTTTFQGDTLWTPPENLGDRINSEAWDSHPTLSQTEDTLYFSSDRPGGFGLADLYFTYKDAKGRWARSQNLGPVINTRNNEVSPFYHPKYHVLYFSSNGHLLNFGDYDIYKTYQKGDDWSEPVNIGPLVNGKGTEFYFSIDRESSHIFYARSEEESMKNLDLYSFPLPMEGQPTATTRFSGIIRAPRGKIPQNVVVSIIDLEEGIEVAPKFAREDGTFEFDLINQRNYLLIIQGDDFFRIEKLFFLDGDTSYEGVVERVANKIEFESIEFENEKADILPAMERDLKKVIDFLIDHPAFKLNVSGHTDSTGKTAFNLKLSQMRADAIRDYIVRYGKVNPERVFSIGYGNQRPIIKNERSEADRKLNRRVEFEIYRDPTGNGVLNPLPEKGADKKGNGR